MSLLSFFERFFLRRKRTIPSRVDSGPYLTRYHQIGCPTHPDGKWPFDEAGNPRAGSVKAKGRCAWIHNIHRSDSEQELHNHPWAWAISIIIWGGYWEERREWDSQKEIRQQITRECWKIVRRWRGPGSISLIRDSTYHRIDVGPRRVWTLFITGPATSGWSFWDRRTGTVVSSKAFRAARGIGKPNGAVG